MDDRFLHEHRREPRPEFARSLRARLRAHERDDEARGFRPAFAGAFAVIAVAVAFLFPSVRVSAHAFLEMFRVRQFAAVQFDANRMEQLRKLYGASGPEMVFDDHQVLRDPGPPQFYPSLELGAGAAGLAPLRLSYLPRDLAADSVWVNGEGGMRLTLHDAKLRETLDRLGLGDVRVPSGFDGQPIEVRKPPVLIQQYRAARARATLVQARNPDVGLPAGADLAALGEVGLRVLGLDPSEARRVASSIDWRSTIVVPVPLDASSFRAVTIQGHGGLLVTRSAAHGGRDGSLVMWADGERIFAVETNLGGPDAVQMAESVR